MVFLIECNTKVQVKKCVSFSRRAISMISSTRQDCKLSLFYISIQCIRGCCSVTINQNLVYLLLQRLLQYVFSVTGSLLSLESVVRMENSRPTELDFSPPLENWNGACQVDRQTYLHNFEGKLEPSISILGFNKKKFGRGRVF